MTTKPKGRAFPIDAHVGRRVRLRRQMLNMSQTDLAKVAKITFQQVQKYENGTNRISASRLQQFADALDVEVGFFFEGASTGKRTSKPDPTALIEDFVASGEGRSLIKAFMRIKDKGIRRRLIDLARGITE
jgi:transcriptional regulator with XRE-family HTH domain